MALEDYTTYTVVDPNNRFDDEGWSSPQNTIAVTALSRNEDARVTKDFGVDFFGDITLGTQWDNVVTAASATNANLYTFGISNTLDDGVAHATGQLDSIWGLIQVTGAGAKRIVLVGYGTGTKVDTFSSWVIDTCYYFTLTRSAGTNVLKIYDDVNRTSLVDTLTISGATTDALRYFYAANSGNDGETTNITSEIANHELLDIVGGFGAALMSSSLYLGGGRVW